MSQKALMLTLTLTAGFALGAISDRALNAQQTPPAKGSGQTSRVLVTHDVGLQIPELKGYELEMKLLKIEPGGHGRLHSHEDRPVIHYILQGTFSSCDPHGTCTEIQEGQAWAEGRDVKHWPANRGTKPLAWLAIEIKKKS